MHAGEVDADTEAGWIADSRQALEQFTDRPIKGWLSPGRLQTANTPELLVKNGFTYQCDWVNDELPYTFKTTEGDMTLSAVLSRARRCFCAEPKLAQRGQLCPAGD
jgi:hypothetical protein